MKVIINITLAGVSIPPAKFKIRQGATDLVALRRKLYLTLQSSLKPEEAAHKLMKLGLEGKDRTEMCSTIMDCCAEQRTYIKFYGLLARNLCGIANEYVTIFSSVFADCFSKIDSFLDAISLRNVAKFFSYLLVTDSIPWTVFSCIKLNEDDTTSASRVFIQYLFKEINNFLWIERIKARIADPTLQEAFAGIFPRDNPRDTRFAIMFFQNIGLHPLVEHLVDFLKAKPADDVKEEQLDEKPAVEKKSNKRKRKDESPDSSSESEDESSSSSSSVSPPLDSRKTKKYKKHGSKDRVKSSNE